MAIPAELRAFGNEAGFRDRFVMPLLHRLGFSIVVKYHGQREFASEEDHQTAAVVASLR